MKPAEKTHDSISVLMELLKDVLPKGVLNIVQVTGLDVGKPLASSPRIAKIAFTGSTAVGRSIMEYATKNIIPVTLELGGKSPNIFFEDAMDADDDYLDKAVEGYVLFALNSGEICTAPSRALIHESIYDKFMEKAIERVKAIKIGNPLDTEKMMGEEDSQQQLDKIFSFIDIGKEESAELVIGGNRNQ